ncbi:FAD-binding domain-containing protein [Mycena rosella]|uniref:FAD-binding domain-containing protein n=1 Tax=Mycena rosella TaxID=1033263 RepID=A0AAD7MAD4_MYCRO|nr:FAD-binding domain-containing protein [Mycena rosella]
MKSLSLSLLLLLFTASRSSCGALEIPLEKRGSCRNVPGSPGYPTAAAWDAFNATISGRLVTVVPSAKFCTTLPGGACTDAQWSSAVFRNTIPGAMSGVNFEQGYGLTPPSLCLRNATTCGQGDVPIYSVEAETVEDIQAAVKFASANNLRVAVKASGHDMIGRSTAPQSLLIRTTNLRNISFIDAFQDMGSAVTVGSGVPFQTLFQQAKASGRAVVGPSVATICGAGGYVQGAGHSYLSPKFGLAADNALEFNIVVSSGELLKVNSVSNPDLFYALRGGGAGSWGVITSVTFKTFPTFNATATSITLAASNTTQMRALAVAHAEHVFALDPVGSGHFFITEKNPAGGFVVILLSSVLGTPSETMTLLGPFMDAALEIPGVSLVSQQYTDLDVNDSLFKPDDSAGSNAIEGSRFITADTYRNSPTKVGQVYEELLNSGTEMCRFEIVVGGGKVSENANISSAVHPGWRTAKTLFLVVNSWEDSASLDEIDALRHKFQTQQLPIIEQISGPNAGTYSNEADGFEPEFQTTFFGPNYAKLSGIKAKYDPQDLLIVGGGVGSERWDQWGLCRV